MLLIPVCDSKQIVSIIAIFTSPINLQLNAEIPLRIAVEYRLRLKSVVMDRAALIDLFMVAVGAVVIAVNAINIASNKQTTGLGHVTVADLKRLQFCSNIATINEFEVLAAPIFNAIFAIYKENQHLAALRDTLLPKLMNGEIDVSAVRI